MHNFIKIISVLMCAFFLTSCGRSSIKVNEIRSEYESSNCKITVDKPEFSGFSDENFELELNNEYENLINEAVDSYITKAEKNIDIIHNISITNDIKFNKNNIFSFLSTCVENSEIDGEKTIVITKNIDVDENRSIKLCDIFIDEKYHELLNSKLEKIAQSDIYSDLWKTPEVTDEQEETFYFTDEGLVIYYPPYELSYYKRGYVEFLIKYSELYGYLKPQYNFLLES